MLLGKDRGGDQDRGLETILHHLEGAPDGDFGFAVAHIATNKPVHGFIRGKIANDLGDGLILSRSFIVGEEFFELVVEITGR